MKSLASVFVVLLLAPALLADDAASFEGKSVAQWQAVLGGKDEKPRAHAATSLARIGPPAADAIPALAKALLNSPKNEDLRVDAAIAIGKIGGKGEEWRRPHIPPRHVPDEPAGEPGKGDEPKAPDPPKDPAAEKRSAILRDQAVPALVKALQDPCEDVRTNATRSLGLIGEEASAAIPALVKALGEKAQNVRRNAIAAFQTVPGPPEIVIPVIGKALADADATVANSAARALMSLGPKALPALKDLEAALARDVEKTRSTLPDIAGHAGPGQWPTLSCNLCLALGGIGKGAAPALPTIFRVLKAVNVPARNAALQAIDGIRSDPEKSVAVLIPVLQDPDPSVRGLAPLVLAGFGPDARPALPAIEKLRDSSSGNIRKNAEAAIDRIAGKAVATGAGEELPAEPGGFTTYGGSSGGTVEVWRD
jgi:HEAT repeat protein